jgi:hypothetical protein
MPCHCTEGGLCPLYNDRFLLKTGTCRVPLPPPDPADPTAQELGIEMLVQAMQHNPELMRTSTKAERKELAEQTYRRHSRRTNRAAVYLAAAHFNDCDVEYEFVGGRWRATLKAETQHADARRNLHKKKFKQPMPSRPLKGNTLGDGLDQSVWSWSAQQAAAEGGRSSRRAPRPQFASPNRTGGNAAAGLVSPMDIATQGRSPLQAAVGQVQAVDGGDGDDRDGDHAAAEACTRRQELGWHHPDDARRVQPEHVDARGNFVCSFTMAVTLAEHVHAHAKACSGTLTWSPQRMSQKGCCGRMVGVCSCVECPMGGEVVWCSDQINAATGHLFANDCFGAVVGACDSQYTSLASAFNCMQMAVPERTTTYDFVGDTVEPAVEQLAEADFDAVLAVAGDGPLAVAQDAAHDAVRNAKNTVLGTVELQSGCVCDVQTSSEGTAASREPVLVETALDKLETKGKDVALVLVDGCKDVHAQVRARPRRNCAAVREQGKPVEEALATDTGVDSWHGLKSAKKAMPKQVKKSTDALATFYTEVVGGASRAHGVELSAEFVMEAVPGLIHAHLRKSFETEYAPFLEAAAAAAAAGLTWADACADEEKLRQFGAATAVLEAAGTVDLTLLGAGAGDDDEDGGGADLCLVPGGADNATHDEGTAIQKMLEALNAIIVEKNSRRKKQLRTYDCLGSINPDEPALGIQELATVLVGLEVQVGGRPVTSVADVVDRCGTGGKKAKKAELVAAVHAALPSTKLIKGGVELATLLKSGELRGEVTAAVRALMVPAAAVSPDALCQPCQPPRKRQAQRLPAAERACIQELTAAERRKGDASDPAIELADRGVTHPSLSLTSPLRTQLEPGKLSSQQLRIALKFYGVAFGEDPVSVLTAVLASDPLTAAVDAIREAGKVVSSNNEEHKQHHSHSVSHGCVVGRVCVWP